MAASLKVGKEGVDPKRSWWGGQNRPLGLLLPDGVHERKLRAARPGQTRDPYGRHVPPIGLKAHPRSNAQCVQDQVDIRARRDGGHTRLFVHRLLRVSHIAVVNRDLTGGLAIGPSVKKVGVEDRGAGLTALKACAETAVQAHLALSENSGWV